MPKYKIYEHVHSVYYYTGVEVRNIKTLATLCSYIQPRELDNIFVQDPKNESKFYPLKGWKHFENSGERIRHFLSKLPEEDA